MNLLIAISILYALGVPVFLGFALYWQRELPLPRSAGPAALGLFLFAIGWPVVVLAVAWLLTEEWSERARTRKAQGRRAQGRAAARMR